MFQQLTAVGNLGNEVEMRYTPSGVAVASFSLAVNKSWTNQDGQRQDKTTWMRITCWRKLAETVAQHLAKGSQVMVIGEIEEARVYQAKDGEHRASLEVTANIVKFLGGKAGAAPEPQQGFEPAGPDVGDGENIPF